MPSDALCLRPIRDEDLPFLFRLYASTREEELSAVGWTPEQKEGFLQMQFAAQHHAYTTNYPGAELALILVGQVAAGRLYLHERSSEIRVVDIALMPAFRGRGIGSRLLGEVQARAQSHGLSVSIHVESFNPAARLYTRLGFTKVAENGAYNLLEWRPPG